MTGQLVIILLIIGYCINVSVFVYYCVLLFVGDVGCLFVCLDRQFHEVKPSELRKAIFHLCNYISRQCTNEMLAMGLLCSISHKCPCHLIVSLLM